MILLLQKSYTNHDTKASRRKRRKNVNAQNGIQIGKDKDKDQPKYVSYFTFYNCIV